MHNSIAMTRFASTIAAILDAKAPEGSDRPIDSVLDLKKMNSVSRIDKVLIFNPDAIALWLFQKYTEDFAPVLKHMQMGIPVSAMMPSVTPVNFGSMYTGVTPAEHGITTYRKVLIERDSLFDTLPKAGRKVALLTRDDSSMSILWGGRDVDYYVFDTDEAINQKAQELVEENAHDVIVVYNMEYDDMIHAHGAESKEAMNAMHKHISAFDALAEKTRQCWAKDNTFLVWATDHGIHDVEDGLGIHGTDMDEDMNVMHFFGIQPGTDSL